VPKLERAELWRVHLPLVAPFESGAGREDVRDLLLVHLETTEGDGWGECAALTAPLYTSEYVDGAEHVIRHHLLPRLFAAETTPEEAIRCWSPVKGHPMAKACLELAVLDADLRARGISLARYLGGGREAVEAGVTVGLQESIPALLEAVSGYVAEGYRRVKLKIVPGRDVEWVGAVREAFPDLGLQVDANCAYQISDAGHLRRLDPFDLLLIEQPLAEERLAEHAELARRVRTPICLDESITSAHVAAAAIEMGACSVISIKPGRLGGYLEARRTHDLCMARDVPVWIGGMLESGIGRAANAAVAALPGFTLPGDLSASDRYYRRDLITEPFRLEQGRLTVPAGPGLGVLVDVETIRELATAHDVLTAREAARDYLL
jgi:O-succinylbenzoate synthase